MISFQTVKRFGSLIKYKNNDERLILTTLLSNFSRKEFIMVIMLDSNFITRGSVFVCFLLFLLRKLSMKRKKNQFSGGRASIHSVFDSTILTWRYIKSAFRVIYIKVNARHLISNKTVLNSDSYVLYVGKLCLY